MASEALLPSQKDLTGCSRKDGGRKRRKRVASIRVSSVERDDARKQRQFVVSVDKKVLPGNSLGLTPGDYRRHPA